MQPNGLAFSPDESLLYIADTGLTHKADGPHHVRRFKVSADGRSISGGEVFATCPVGLYDGFRVDVHGNLWLSAGDGVHCHASDGSLLGKILIPESVANVCFGGPKLNRLFICGDDVAVFGVPEHARGAARLISGNGLTRQRASNPMAMNDVYAVGRAIACGDRRAGWPDVIEFGTPWCGYCRAAQPRLAAAFADHPDVRHIKIADGSGRALGRSFKVRLWPTLIFLRDGKEIARLVRPADVGEIRQGAASRSTASE